MIDARLESVLQVSLGRINSAMQNAVDNTCRQLGMLAAASNNNTQRQLLMSAEFELQRKTSVVQQSFFKELQRKTAKDLHRFVDPHQDFADTDWNSLSLVDNAEVERDVIAGRIAQSLGAQCDSAFQAVRELLTALIETADDTQLPLSPQSLSKILLSALSEVSMDLEITQTIAQQISHQFAKSLPQCYELTRAELSPLLAGSPALHQAGQKNKIKSGGPSRNDHSRQFEGQEGPLSTQSGAFSNSSQAPLSPGQESPPAQLHQRAAKALSDMFGMPMPNITANATALSQSASQHFNALIRRITHSSAGEQADSLAAPSMTAIASPPLDQGLPGGSMMAVNMIRAHREELISASGGAALDQMVIDIVAALFDQVLSDPKVSPQMARQIARLQLPVLRVALKDVSFFNSRKHPVRQFVNRIASLSATFDDYEQGPGKACLDQVTELVTSLVEGDFEQLDLYASKLKELEGFVDQQNQQERADATQAASLLSNKEADLKVQQRYKRALVNELSQVEMPDFVREFLTNTWSQVMVLVNARDGSESAMAQRFKRTSHELVLSVQPKGATHLRKEFLTKLPQLMKDLNEGLALIQWPDRLKQEFLSKLLPSHAESLKTQPQHELTQRMLEAQLSKVEKIAIPSREEACNDTIPNPLDLLGSTAAVDIPIALSAEEIKLSGFINESALIDSPLDIDLESMTPQDPCLQDIDINLDAPPPPASGTQLVHHIHKGTAYQMLVHGEWKKVRLTWVSEGRSFFIFTQGQQRKQTISLTGRTLAKMCESRRFKAFEQAELLERATMRARRQLAELSTHKSAA